MSNDTFDSDVRIGVAGAAGKMGKRLCALADSTDGTCLTEAFDHPESPALGAPATEDPESVTIEGELSGECDVLIDFSSPAATRVIVQECVDRKIPLVIGTTGLTKEDVAAIDAAGHKIPILYATNFSLVVNVLNVLAARAAQLLGDAYDIEIVEAHHKFKKDAPSGTALTLAEVICDATDRDFDTDVLTGRAGDDVTRRPGEITVQALRLGDVVGEHTVMYATAGERLELKHISTNRDSYAGGAVRAAAWLADKKPGRYAMADVLGLNA
ncbi:MAG: 4-hydroxy-tetrahydrodipicolinate reductase [Planctomycetota bacterium]|jgi:4-hydroxy-tetrahydrodipicolinate reductase